MHELRQKKKGTVNHEGNRRRNVDRSKPVLLFLNDRPESLADALFQREDIIPVLLRFRQILGDLGQKYIERTKRMFTFVADMEVPLVDEARRFCKWADSQGLDVGFFCNPSEPRQRISHAFARELGLPALTEQQVTWLRDKASMKDKLRAIGFDVAEYALVGTHADVIAFAKSRGFPVVVKPREGYACLETHLIRTEDDVSKQPLVPEWTWMVEKFVPDREYECCALISKGRVLDTYLSCFPAPPLAATDGAINANISMRRVPEQFGVDMNAVVQRIVDSMELQDGYMHMEFFVGSGGRFTMSEVAMRMAGCEITANHGLAYGFNIFDAILDIYLHREPKLVYAKDRVVGDLLLPVRSGRVSYITPLSELLELEGVLSGKLKVRVGDLVAARRASHVSSGFLHIEGSSPTEVERRMRNALESFQLVTEPYDDNMSLNTALR